MGTRQRSGTWQTHPRKPKAVGSDSDEAGPKQSTGLPHPRGLESPATFRFSASLSRSHSDRSPPASAELKSRGVLCKMLGKREELYGKYKGDFTKLGASAQILLELKPVYL